MLNAAALPAAAAAAAAVGAAAAATRGGLLLTVCLSPCRIRGGVELHSCRTGPRLEKAGRP